MSSLEPELRQLQQANRTLVKLLEEDNGFFFSLSATQARTQSLNAKNADKLEALHNRFYKEKARHSDIHKLSLLAGGGKPLTPAQNFFLRKICEVTTYCTNNKQRRSKYTRTHSARQSRRLVALTKGQSNSGTDNSKLTRAQTSV